MNPIFIYNFINIIIFPVYIIVFLIRLLRGKENIRSIKSKLGFYNKRELDTYRTLNNELIWIHAASVGESLIAISLINHLKKKYTTAKFLITSGTLSSAHIINNWISGQDCHEFTPLDNFFVVIRFYRYWRPTIGIFMECELWPTLVQCSASYCKLLLINARLSDKSYQLWLKFPRIFSSITSFFSSIYVQSDSDYKKYKSLNCKKVKNLGNLKFANPELKVDLSELNELKNIFKDKKIFVAASTHYEDEEVLFEVILNLKKQQTNIYPIVILRHPSRATEVAAICQKLGLRYLLRSRQIINAKIIDNSDLYIVDCFSKLGLFYSLSDIAFVGGSFKKGCHNLLEPANFDNIILVGPDVSNWQNIANEMILNKSIIQIKNANDLYEKMAFFCDNKNAVFANQYKVNAKKYVNDKKIILTKYLDRIEKAINSTK